MEIFNKKCLEAAQKAFSDVGMSINPNWLDNRFIKEWELTEILPFDTEKCLSYLAESLPEFENKIPTHIDYPFELDTFMSKEEAAFWLTAIPLVVSPGNMRGEGVTNSEKIIKEMTQWVVSTEYDFGKILKLRKSRRTVIDSSIFFPLFNLLSWEEMWQLYDFDQVAFMYGHYRRILLRLPIMVRKSQIAALPDDYGKSYGAREYGIMHLTEQLFSIDDAEFVHDQLLRTKLKLHLGDVFKWLAIVGTKGLKYAVSYINSTKNVTKADKNYLLAHFYLLEDAPTNDWLKEIGVKLSDMES